MMKNRVGLPLEGYRHKLPNSQRLPQKKQSLQQIRQLLFEAASTIFWVGTGMVVALLFLILAFAFDLWIMA